MKTTSKNENKFAAIFQARQDPVPVETKAARKNNLSNCSC